MRILAFKRVEKKYLINSEQYNLLLSKITDYMELDPYCNNNATYKIQNIYYDTMDNYLITNSISKPVFKEKLRVRKYLSSDLYFIELKRKACGVVGKRRVIVDEAELNRFFNGDDLDEITEYESKMAIKEIRYLLTRYTLSPKVYISYDRLGFFDRSDSSLRLTFDSNIHARRDNLNFESDEFKTKIINDDEYLLEIKATNNYPLWLVKILNECKIIPSSFSKYGREYMMDIIGGKNV